MRYLSLDFFRGLTIALMIVVNTPGTWSKIFAPLRHAEWHGCTPTDLVFPFFLFIVGVALWFSFSKFNRQLTPALTQKILRRTALIVLVGLALNAFPGFDTKIVDGVFRFSHKNWPEFRFMGVLQRIGLAYGIGAFLCILLAPRHLYLAAGALLAWYWALMGLGGPDPYALEHNFARQVDLAVLTAPHLYKGFGIPFDPEGLLSTLPAVVNVLLGYLTGSWIASKGSDKRGLAYLLLRNGVAIAAAGLLWSAVFPLNKPLWTSSYVLYTSGLAMLFLAFCIWVFDIKNWQAPAKPFLVFGANPLFAFVLSGLLVKTMNLFKYVDAEGKTRSLYYWIYQNIFYRIEPGEFGSLLFALSYAGLIWALCWVLYKRKIFIKI
jgi:predicted acyltransferase